MPVSLKAIRPKKFKLLDPTVTRREAAKGIQEYLQLVRDQLNEGYKTVPPSKSYKRTKRMYRGWKIQSGYGNYGILTNTEPHTVFAVGPRGGYRHNGQRQTDVMRAKGWRSITDVARETAPLFAQIANRSIGPRVSDSETYTRSNLANLIFRSK